ncbi:hypothetical protein KIJ05_07745 [Leuconostoc gelidum subsp. gasicomitatum]|uniref:hypothetical protein n=1 Tax=Leuconostoc gasicomitatum TaxID=115778 RepID=UPI001CC61D6A|nr:hypothetical protein [Leuconostoc gasicomitatum]MBZ5985009.1 hypothetical protein [Leuconostoc gasicomitatum]
MNIIEVNNMLLNTVFGNFVIWVFSFFLIVLLICTLIMYLVPKITKQIIVNNIDSENIIQNKALEKYSFWRAILLIGLSIIVSIIPIAGKSKHIIDHMSFFGGVVVVISILLFFLSTYWFCIYESIARPIWKDGAKRDNEYKKMVNDYRSRMNIVFTIFLLTSVVIGIDGYLISIEPKVTIGLSWITIPSFISGVVYLITTEKVLEDIYSVYFVKEYYEQGRIS